MIHFDNVSLRYPTGPQILSDINFRIEPGSFHFILGESGSGKSSLLRMMYLGLNATRGRISLFGRDVGRLDRSQRAELRCNIGVIFQDFRLLNHMTTMENVLLTQEVTGRASKKSQRDVAELLTWVGLGDHLEAYPETLSGGQQQRIAIARAVVGRPSLLIADEPTGNLDNKLAVRLLYLFEELNRLGTTVVIATHNESLTRRFPHATLALQEGHVVFQEPMSERLSDEPFSRVGRKPAP